MSDNVLAQIVADKAAQNQQQAEQYPLSQIQPLLAPSQRSLYQALSQVDAGFILECKKASPSKGLIRADFDPIAIARAYQPYAAAISVLTEPDYFQGRLEYLTAVSQSVHQPVLCKDFFVDEQQVYRARYFGADAILLMLSVLDDAQYQRLSNIAEQLKMDVLTEVANEQEMRRANALDARIIGINHRDLTNLTIDPERSAKLAPLAPKDALLVAESGFSSNTDIRRVAPHVNGFLVGSALTAQENIDHACRQLLFGHNKVCGLCRPEDATVVASAGARYAGLIFAKRSPRAVTVDKAQQVIAAAPSMDYIGVFADQPLLEVVDTCVALGLAAAQLHGHEDIDYIRQLRQALNQAEHHQCQIWQAVRVQQPRDWRHLADRYDVDRFVLDNGSGGTGNTFDWGALRDMPSDMRQRCLLAGGIAPDNASDALQLGVAGVDSSSRLEQAVGVKNAVQIQRLFRQLRHYGRFSQQTSAVQEAV